MLTLKRFLVLTIICTTIPVVVMGQVRPGVIGPGGREMTVEESYLQESIELMIIREQSRSDSRDMKFIALEYIGDAIGRGLRHREIHSALEFLALEGVVNVARENGRVVNNFPDVRRQAATYLGKLGTPEAQATLMTMVNRDNEPLVISEAVRSLGIIGNNENNEVTRTIAWTVNRFHGLNPDNFLALSALDAFERIAIANGGLVDRTTVDTIIRIAEGPYITPVQNRARLLLRDIRSLSLGQ